MAQLDDLDYEAIENAVLETARGRWFLAEYKKRNGVAGTQTLLDAISRLEKVISGINNQDLSNNATSEPVESTVDPVAAAIAKPIASAPLANFDNAEKSQEEQLNDENLQFFSNDEDLFASDTSAFLPETPQAPAIHAKSDEKPAEPALKVKTDATTNNKKIGADEAEPVSRVKITRAAKETAPEPQPTPPATPKGAETEVPEIAMSPTNEETDRIVIIRKSATSDIEIPLADSQVEDGAEASTSSKP